MPRRERFEALGHVNAIYALTELGSSQGVTETKKKKNYMCSKYIAAIEKPLTVQQIVI